MELLVVEAAETHTHVKLKGTLDAQGREEVDIRFHAVIAGRGKPTLVDFSRVEFIDSLGMGMLISCARALKRQGAPMVLVRPRLRVERALRVAGLHVAFPIVHGIDLARSLLQASPSGPAAICD